VEYVYNFIKVNKGKSVMVFTDGSVYNVSFVMELVPMSLFLYLEMKTNIPEVKLLVKRFSLSHVNLKASFLDWS